MNHSTWLGLLLLALVTGCARQGTDNTAGETVERTGTAASEDHGPIAMAGDGLCRDAGPQAPRDISSTAGSNAVAFPLAPPPVAMNLCNIHTHTHAEHKGPGFSLFVGADEHGGFACNDTAELSAAELTDPARGKGAFEHVAPGDTIEVHWVYSSCDVGPGPGLEACLGESCSDPLLRVEAQVFMLVNDANALDFADYTYAGVEGGRHQARALPSATGTPVVFRGSTTGPAYTSSRCSPVQVTWSVRPQCAKLDVSSLHRWAEAGNVFQEHESHGVRQLVVAPQLLAPIP